MEINVNNNGSNITITINNDYWFDVYHDNCIDFPYDVNLESVIENVAMIEERELTDEEEQLIEEKVSTWLNAHSCEDDEYYDKAERRRIKI